MTSRRAVLAGGGCALALPLIDGLTSLANHRRGRFTEPNAAADNTLYVSYSYGRVLGLGSSPEPVPRSTWQEYLYERVGHVPAARICRYCFEQGIVPFGVHPVPLPGLKKDEDWLRFVYWIHAASPMAHAFNRLEELGIGFELPGPKEFQGNLSFIDGLFRYEVSADDDVSVALLQERLNSLNTGIAVKSIA